VLALGGAAAVGAVVSQLVEDDSPPVVASSSPASGSGGSRLLSLPAAIAAVEPSVVQVQGTQAQGSGVVVAPSGLIVTNEHVVSGETTLTITTADDRQTSAEVVTTDPNSDLAILRPVGPPGPGVLLAEEADGGLRQGDTVFAIGSPFGLRSTVTSGVVSSLGRRGDRGQPVVQTDTAINPGNSGGGLFDLRGRLVGIPTEIRSPVPGNVGIGFAVTTEPIKSLLARVS
jgi:S1-C subfamily serine protease